MAARSPSRRLLLLHVHTRSNLLHLLRIRSNFLHLLRQSSATFRSFNKEYRKKNEGNTKTKFSFLSLMSISDIDGGGE